MRKTIVHHNNKARIAVNFKLGIFVETLFFLIGSLFLFGWQVLLVVAVIAGFRDFADTWLHFGS